MKYQNLRFYSSIGFFLILAGLLLGSSHFIKYWQQKNSQPVFAQSLTQQSTLPAKATVSGFPSHIAVPSVDISVDIDPGYYNKSSQQWTLSLTKAEYATITPLPNDANGNTFIYGHNRWDVFYKLLKVQAGDQAIVTTTNHHTFTYQMTGQRDTKPTDTSLFTYKGPPILTLQTCSGFWYQNRSLFVFKRVKVA
jgi:LPXTG-site transpeptidase (sortase) family protein